ncbi:MAG: phospho-N-acetylmuramoyl-pentapeptide-transferase [Thermostichales cyanobacterium HHBFW_bins_127]
MGNGLSLALTLVLGILLVAGAGWQGSLVSSEVVVVSAGLTGLVGIPAVALLRAWKTGQVIRREGPQSHQVKAGTPTMGGLYFLGAAIAVSGGWSWWQQGSLGADWVAAVVVLLAYGAVGWLDDWQVIRQQSNQGLTPNQKLILQILIAVAFCAWLSWRGAATILQLPGLGGIPLGWGYWLLGVFALLATNNAVNLTDGLDGLAAGTVALVALGLAFLPGGDPSLTGLCLALAGACWGFLLHNRYPAQVFMGDTGALGLGGGLAAIALLKGCLWALALMGGIFVLEALSVLLQVGYFKYTKKRTGTGQRLLKMSPLHHHLELSGWSELQVVASFYGLTALLVALSYALLPWLPT